MSVVIPNEICEMLSLEQNVGLTRTRKTLIDNVRKKIAADDLFVIDLLQKYTGQTEKNKMIDSVKDKVNALQEIAKVKKESNVVMKDPVRPSGFAAPTNISDDLCEFLKIPLGTEITRTDVTRRIVDYIKKNDLQDINNRSVIHKDAAMTRLIPEDTELTYFNLQVHLNRHFIRKAPLTQNFHQ
jgi:chromatin remodeling complex protein RSC6